MINGTLVGFGARQRIDILTGDDPDAIGAIRIVRGNVPNTIKAILVGNDDLHEGFCGPMFDGNFVFAHDGRFAVECQRVMREAWGALWTGEAVNVHDRYESPADYARLCS